jgi:hypothetical protein
MKKAIAIGVLGLALVSNRAAAQTAVEQAQILRDFQRSVADYTQGDTCLLVPEATTAVAPVPKVFTLPVAMVFRQLIAHAFANGDTNDIDTLLREVLPVLPAPLEYRLADHNLVIRDTGTDEAVAVLRDAVALTTFKR